MPPNCTKVLFHWGLRAKLLEKSLVTHTLLFTRCRSVALHVDLHALTIRADETGEYLGSHVWDQGVMKETRGLYLLTTVRPSFCAIYKAQY